MIITGCDLSSFCVLRGSSPVETFQLSRLCHEARNKWDMQERDPCLGNNRQSNGVLKVEEGVKNM
jgi:hypothetical protein